MILTCPQCSTRYTVDETKFPSQGRTVRCAKCAHSWHQPGPEPEPVAAEPDLAPVIPDSTLTPVASGTRGFAPAAQVAERPRGQLLQTLAVVAGWIGLVVVVLLIGYSAVRYRQDIATIWPQSAGIYSGLGLKTNVNGLTLNASYKRESEDGQAVLVVTGSIVNTSSRELPVPPLRVTLTDAANHELYHWPYKPEMQTLKAGGTLTFRTRLSSPPAAARFAIVSFSKDGS